MRPISSRVARENAAFLDALRDTGNAAMAAQVVGMHRTTFDKRRRRHAAFAAGWDAALVIAAARLQAQGGPHRPLKDGNALRTQGGEPTVTRGKNRPIQLRRARAGQLSAGGEAAFMRALAASANIRLSADSIGVEQGAIYRRRAQSPAFAEEMRIALESGYVRLETAAVEAACVSLAGDGTADMASREGTEASNPLFPMTAAEALHLLTIHKRAVRTGKSRFDKKRLLPSIETVRAEVLRKIEAMGRAERYEESGTWTLPEQIDTSTTDPKSVE